MSSGYTNNYPTSGYASETQLRNEFERVRFALSDTISRTNSGSGSNAMQADLDMGGNQIINLSMNPDPANTDAVNVAFARGLIGDGSGVVIGDVVREIIAGDNVEVDSTDPERPVVSANVLGNLAGVNIDAVGTLAERDGFDNEAEGFVYYATDAQPSIGPTALFSRFTSTASQTTFPITFEPSGGAKSVLVTVNGVPQGADKYTVEENLGNYSVVFLAALDSGDSVAIRDIEGNFVSQGAIFVKQSATSGDWSPAAYMGRGPRGQAGIGGDEGDDILVATDRFAPDKERLVDALNDRWSVLAEDALEALAMDVRFGLNKTVEDFGAIGDGTTDDTAAIQAALNTGHCRLSPGKTYSVTTQLYISLPGTAMWTDGISRINYDVPAASPARPMLFVQPSAPNTRIFGNIIFNHNGAGQTEPTEFPTGGGGGDPIWGSAVFISADDVSVVGVEVENGFDNGIAVARFDDGTSPVTPATPARVGFSFVRGRNNGVGIGAVGQLGATIDIGSGIECTMTNCFDYGSRIGFIIDVGAGGNCAMNNCVAVANPKDTSSNLNPNSGLGFYIGGADSSINNCQSWFAETDGWWIDAPAQYSSFTGCLAYGPARHGYRVDCSKSTFTGCVTKVYNLSNGTSTHGTGHGFYLNPGSPITDLVMTGIQAETIYGTGQPGDIAPLCMVAAPQSAGAFIQATVVNPIFRQGNLQPEDVHTTIAGAPGAVVRVAIFGGYQGGMQSGDIGGYRPGVAASGNIVVSTVPVNPLINIWGDAGVDAAGLMTWRNTGLQKRMVAGFSEVGNFGQINCIDPGIGHLPLRLNPYGGDIILGKSDFANPIQIGDFWLWSNITDSPTGLYIKQGTKPVSALDGSLLSGGGGGSIPQASAADIIVGTSTTASSYSPQDLNSAITTLVLNTVQNGVDRVLVTGNSVNSNSFVWGDGGVSQSGLAVFDGSGTERLVMGCDQSNNWGQINSINPGVGHIPLRLNPYGGGVSVGPTVSSWQSPLRIGQLRLWYISPGEDAVSQGLWARNGSDPGFATNGTRLHNV